MNLTRPNSLSLVLCFAGMLVACRLPAAEPAKAAGGAAPEKGLDLYLLIGQSNMAGRGAVEEADRVPHPRVFMFTKDEKWVAAIDPLHFDKPTAGVGLGSSFGRAMADAMPTAKIGLIPCAVGGTPLERWLKGGDLWKQAVARAKLAQASGKLKGILWHQGEADSRDKTNAETYAARLAQMVRDLREELGAPQAPFVAGKLGEFLGEAEEEKKTSYWRLINEQIEQLPKLVEKTAVVESKGLIHKGDKVHFDSPSLREFGKRYAEAMQRLLPRTSAASSAAIKDHPSYAKAEDVDGLPRVLLIGDSISMQYTLPVRSLLTGRANVHRPADNCRTTRQTLERIEAYLGDRSWDVIHFNWGIHDVTYLDVAGKVAPPPAGRPQVSLEEYEQNLRRLVARLKRTGARLVWASTTPIGAKAEALGYRHDADIVAYNAAAVRVMQEEGVPIDDLYALVKPQVEELLADGVHFRTEQVAVASESVAAAIRDRLP